MQGQEERITDIGVMRQVRRQARRVYTTASLLALVLTGVCLLIPL